MGGIYECGCKEVYIDYLIKLLLILSSLVSVLFCSSIPIYFLFIKKKLFCS